MSEHVIYSSFVVEKYKHWNSDRNYEFRFRWYLPNCPDAGSAKGFYSEWAAVEHAHRTFGMT